ncbi:uncharacterized protein BKCO1_900007 [Diplodia corticola]|uniref:Uncharacterized protein n=1 Tax=Diplodia corticola TaxID=236234 RepID=A0A1J9QM80_9PEZI|nr:uncharacterized protein BKCO1_900007 [Diplodia corticola]OJD29162.1 hypothetical protein BKCO1_900007 [Diplodia corticola]
MASAAPALCVQTNGDDQHLASETRRLADFYQQLLQLRDEVLAGKHPRLKLPDHALEKLRQQPHARPPSAARPPSNAALNGAAPHAYPHPSHSSSSYNPTPSTSFARPQSSQRPPALKPSSSGIDPVLLTKSDDLVRAEIQLKRQRIERTLKDQVDQKRVQSRDRDGGVDAEPLDVSDVLTKALAIAQPVSGLRSETNSHSPTSDSFDENSYYSSQANSWTSSDHDSSGTASAVDVAGGVSSNPKAAAAPLSHGNTEADAQTLSQMEMRDDMELIEDGDESDYEPPGAEAFTTAPPPPTHGPVSSQNQHSTHGSLPSPRVPVITNHIQTPVAPQPARVSPLTFAKVPGLDAPRGSAAQPLAASTNSSPRNGPRGKGNGNSPRSGRQSPAAPRQQNNSRKRRREAKEAEKADKQRRVSNNNKRAADSPEPYIKEEPVSPPPLAGLAEPAQDARRKATRTVQDDVEIVSPRDAARPVYYMEYEQPAPAPRYEFEPEVVRVPSRMAYRRSERDDQDLRRMASIQHARRPYSPLQPAPYESVRAVSHAYLDGHATPVFREGSVRPGATRYIRSDRSLSPPYAVDPYHRIRSPAIMGPPPVPRRVVMDQYGNRYYAEPAMVDRRASVAPAPRRIGEEMLYERARTREPTMRPVARVEAYEEDEASQRMLPPQPRRYVEQPELEIVEPHRPYRQREYSMRPGEPLREDLGPAQEPLERHPPARYEEMPPPPRGEYLPRAYSVRPDAIRREVPAEYMSRHGSVAPGGGYARRVEALPPGYRAVSVVHEGDGFDERRYAYAPQHPARRYVDEPEIIERPMEAQEYGGEARNIAYRY